MHNGGVNMPQMNNSEGRQPEKTAVGGPKGRTSDVTVRGREKITVTGVEEVLSFDEGTVVMSTALGTLSVDGNGLNVTRLDLDGGEVCVEGCFIGMYYVDPRKKGGRRFFGRG